MKAVGSLRAAGLLGRRSEADPIPRNRSHGAHWQFGQDGIYVKGVSPDGRSTSGEWQVSNAGGLEPRWRGDGKELFYVAGSTLMAVDVKTDGASFDTGIPKPLFETSLPPEPRRNRFVVTRDGQRFLVNTPVDQMSEPIDVLVNWLPAKR